MKKILMLLLFTTFLILPAFAESKNPIDETEQTCLNKAVSTIDSNACETKAYNAWDSEMNKYYNLLAKKLSQKQKQELLKSQFAWLKFRDSNFLLSNDIITSQDGTIWGQISVQERKNIVKQRALSLKTYYEIISGSYLAQ